MVPYHFRYQVCRRLLPSDTLEWMIPDIVVSKLGRPLNKNTLEDNIISSGRMIDHFPV